MFFIPTGMWKSSFRWMLRELSCKLGECRILMSGFFWELALVMFKLAKGSGHFLLGDPFLEDFFNRFSLNQRILNQPNTPLVNKVVKESRVSIKIPFVRLRLIRLINVNRVKTLVSTNKKRSTVVEPDTVNFRKFQKAKIRFLPEFSEFVTNIR